MIAMHKYFYINEKNVYYKIHFVAYYFNIVLNETYWNMLLLMISKLKIIFNFSNSC